MGDFKVRRGFSELLKTINAGCSKTSEARRADFSNIRRTSRALKRAGRAQRSMRGLFSSLPSYP